MKRIFVCVIGAGLVVPLPEPGYTQDPKPSIVGAWKLTSFVRQEVGSGKTVQVLGENPTGYRIHTPGGHASYMFVSGTRKAPAGPMTDADRIELFKTMAAASGTYNVEGDKIIFLAGVSASQSLTGGTLVYRFEISGRTLKMATDPVRGADGQENIFLTTYERLE
jgi:hypothetical protein